MTRASLCFSGFRENAIFDVSSPLARDGGFLPWALLREKFRSFGIDLSTDDVHAGMSVAFEIHMNAHCVASGVSAYALLFETPQILPANADARLLKPYKKIFTWNDERADGDRFIKINFPNPLQVHSPDGWAFRDRFCCIIAGNKSVTMDDGLELYSERVFAIRWFEGNAPEDFDLYGSGWNFPPPRPGVVGKIQQRIREHTGFIPRGVPFPSYRGRVDRKSDVLRRTRFSICYENVRDVPGYITEKIFDCFFSGCVPVYWGASNITDQVPAGCFIDRRNFRDTADVYRYLKAMSEDEYRGYQRNIADFLGGDAARPFGSEAFAETVVMTIVQDLGSLA